MWNVVEATEFYVVVDLKCTSQNSECLISWRWTVHLSLSSLSYWARSACMSVWVLGLYLVHRQKQKSQPGDVESVLPAISSRTVDVVIFARYDCCVLKLLFIHLSPLYFLILVSASFFSSLFLSLSLSVCQGRGWHLGSLRPMKSWF